MTTLTLTPAATFRALHRQQGDVTLSLAVAGETRARHRILGEVTVALLVEGTMRHSFTADAIEGDYYRYFGGVPSFGSSVYDDTWDGGPPNVWGGVSFSYAENTPIFSFGNLFFAAGQGENEMIAERTRLVSEENIIPAPLLYDDLAAPLNPATMEVVDDSIAVVEGGNLNRFFLFPDEAPSADWRYKFRCEVYNAPGTRTPIDSIGFWLDAPTEPFFNPPRFFGGFRAVTEFRYSSVSHRPYKFGSYNNLGEIVNQVFPSTISPIYFDGVEYTIDMEVRKISGLITLLINGVTMHTNWNPGAYYAPTRRMAIILGGSAHADYFRITDIAWGPIGGEWIPLPLLGEETIEPMVTETALEMYPIRTVLERIGLPVMRFDREGRGKVEPNMIKFVRGIYPIIDAPPGTKLLLSIGSQDKVNDATAWEGPFPYIVGEDYFVDFRNSGRYVSIRFESVGQPPWQLLGYDLDVEILGER